MVLVQINLCFAILISRDFNKTLNRNNPTIKKRGVTPTISGTCLNPSESVHKMNDLSSSVLHGWTTHDADGLYNPSFIYDS